MVCGGYTIRSGVSGCGGSSIPHEARVGLMHIAILSPLRFIVNGTGTDLPGYVDISIV